MLVEVCANSLQSALNAQEAGADRIELCSELGVGGITPSYGLLQSIRDHIEIPVHVLIRPRSGDFSYSDTEFEIMKNDITLCKDLGFNGIVTGVLKPDFTLDILRTKELLDTSESMHFTFHRAFDWTLNPLETFEQLEELGVNTLLSSGGQKSASKGMQLLLKLKKNSSTCTIMPGAGIGPKNAHEFKTNGFAAIHLSGTKSHKTLLEKPPLTMTIPSFLEEDKIILTDAETIKNVMTIVK